MGRDYRIGLITGSILVAFTLFWVTTRPSLAPQPRPGPAWWDHNDRNAIKAEPPGTPPSAGSEPRISAPAPVEPAPALSAKPYGPTTRDVNAPAKVTRVHVVRTGETLSAIAELYYGSPNAWRKILAANKTVKDANKIAPGTKLVIPE